MKWFQHSVDSHDDPDISDAMAKFGDTGYSVFFILLELYGREFNNTNEDYYLTLSFVFIRRKLRKSSTKVQQILNFYSDRGRILHKIEGDMVSIKIPSFVKKSDNWTRRKKKEKSTKLRSDSVVTTAIEVRRKKLEEEKNIYGEFKNVRLTEKEFNKLKNKFNSDTKNRIENLSEYIASKGKKYKSHYATILAWDRKNKSDTPKPPPAPWARQDNMR